VAQGLDFYVHRGGASLMKSSCQILKRYRELSKLKVKIPFSARRFIGTAKVNCFCFGFADALSYRV
jgi:hypothetical protein